MSLKIPYLTLKEKIKQALLNAGLTDEQAEICAEVHTQSSADGIESHGLNRVPRLIEYINKGWINLHGKPTLTGAKGAVENYDGKDIILNSEENKGKIALFAGIDKCRFKRQVVPGDTLTLEVEITKIKGPIGKGNAKATVDGQLACSCELTFAIQDVK